MKNYAHGNRIPWSKLDPELVRMVLDWKDDGVSQRDIARALGVSRRTVRDIFRGRTWRRVVEEVRKEELAAGAEE